MDIHRVFGVLLRPFRQRRMRFFGERMRVAPTTRILDVGGTPFNWQLLPIRPPVTLLNLTPVPDSGLPHVSQVIADAVALPFGDGTFDLVFSNSVIEHVGSRDRQRRFAAECRRVGQALFIQTPNRWFFIEPHLLTPFFHWLPAALQRAMIRHLTLRSWISRPSEEWCRSFLATTRLLAPRELQDLFPDAELHKERFLGLTKSLIATRGSVAHSPAPEAARLTAPEERSSLPKREGE